MFLALLEIKCSSSSFIPSFAFLSKSSIITVVDPSGSFEAVAVVLKLLLIAKLSSLLD